MKEISNCSKNLTYNDLCAYLRTLDVDIIGMAHYYGEDSKYIEKVEAKLDKRRLYIRNKMDYHDYVNLNKVIDNPKVVVSIGLNYHQKMKYIEDDNIAYYANISYGIDYHKIMYCILEDIQNYLNNFDINSYISCDTKIIDDKYFAYYCGNGFYGKNNLIVNETYGCEVVYGTLVMDYDLDFIQPNKIASKCANCFKCEANCPTTCINDYDYNYLACMAYLTQSKHMINFNYITKYIYSCDICSNICPYNQIETNRACFNDIGYANLEELILMDKKSFNDKFASKSLSWLNYNIIKKNALLIYANRNAIEDIIILEEKYHKLKLDSDILNKAFDFVKREKNKKIFSKLKNNFKKDKGK